MANKPSSPLAPLIRRALDDARVRGCPDQELLQRFLAGREEAALEALLRRHGPMVLEVCRGVLGNEADAEDAFQATFLVLARKAKSIRKAASLASWLHGVAYRVARKARAESARRQKHEDRVLQERALVEAPDDLTWRELRQVLHEELSGLSERHREPLVLCYLEGKTQDEAAAQLGLPKGTLKGHLERGRALLRARLVRRGLGPAALLAAAWPAASAGECVPAALVSSTVKAAAQGVSWGAAGAGVSANVAALTEGVLKVMFLAKLKIGAAVCLAAGVLAAGLLCLPGAGPSGKEARAFDPPKAGEKPAKARELAEMERKLVGTWQGDGFINDGTITFAKDGTFTHPTPGGPKESGNWTLEDRRLTRRIKESEKKGRVGVVVTREVVEVTHSKLRLKETLTEGRGTFTYTYTRLDKKPRREGNEPDDRGAKSRTGGSI